VAASTGTESVSTLEPVTQLVTPTEEVHKELHATDVVPEQCEDEADTTVIIHTPPDQATASEGNTTVVPVDETPKPSAATESTLGVTDEEATPRPPAQAASTGVGSGGLHLGQST